MSHYAGINQQNIVMTVIYGDGDDKEEEYTLSSADNLTYKRTSYNTFGGIHREGGTPYRKNYACPGMIYDPYRDAFIGPPMFKDMILDEFACIFRHPTPQPEEGGYFWNPDLSQWVQGEILDTCTTQDIERWQKEAEEWWQNTVIPNILLNLPYNS